MKCERAKDDVKCLHQSPSSLFLWGKKSFTESRSPQFCYPGGQHSLENLPASATPVLGFQMFTAMPDILM